MVDANVRPNVNGRPFIATHGSFYWIFLAPHFDILIERNSTVPVVRAVPPKMSITFSREQITFSVFAKIVLFQRVRYTHSQHWISFFFEAFGLCF